MLKYLLCQSQTANPEQLAQILKIGLSEDNKMGTFIDYLIEENKGTWLQTGIEQGIQRGEVKLLIGLLEHKYKTIPHLNREKIENASSEHLLKWGQKVLESRSLDEVFET